MTRVLAVSGSLRAGSFNTALARAAQTQAPAGVSIEVATLHGIPLYDGDAEASGGIPVAVQALRDLILGHDGLLLVTPEYNNGIPGVFKNAIDWLSRTDKAVFANRAVAVIGASPGGFGTILSQNQWLQVLKSLGAQVWSGGRLLVSRANQLIDAEGRMSDAATLQQLAQFLDGFGGFVSRR